jgi:hypothetical protein
LRERGDAEEEEKMKEKKAWVLNEIIPFFIFLQLVWVPVPN